MTPTKADKADKARTLVAAGIDPNDTRKADKAAQAERRQAEKRQLAGLPAAGSFGAVAGDWPAAVHRAKAVRLVGTSATLRLQTSRVVPSSKPGTPFHQVQPGIPMGQL